MKVGDRVEVISCGRDDYRFGIHRGLRGYVIKEDKQDTDFPIMFCVGFDKVTHAGWKDAYFFAKELKVV